MPTSDPDPAQFLLIGCAPGVEPWLKAEIAREHPTLHPSFSRPGLVSFKRGAEQVSPAEVRSVFARVVAVSHGPLAGRDAADFVRARIAAAQGPVRVLVHAGGARRTEASREMTQEVRDTLPEQVRTAAQAALQAALLGAACSVGGVAAVGERVVDFFTAPEDEIWLGEHEHAAPMQPWAAGTAPVELPADAPSRAFLKMEEALRWAGLPVLAGQLVVEVGSAPGGASFALLRRGVNVIGVDPGAMAPQVLAFDGGQTWFRHLDVPVGALSKGDLPKDVDWLALDVNLAPPVALRYVERIVGPRRGRLRGAILTLKMNDAEMAAKIPSLLQHVRKMGFTSVVATQLPSNRREICVVALNPVERVDRASSRPKAGKKAKTGKKQSASRRGSRGPTSR